MKLYIAVTADKYELPMAVADTQRELGKMTGKSEKQVCEAINKKMNGTRTGVKFLRVDVD